MLYQFVFIFVVETSQTSYKYHTTYILAISIFNYVYNPRAHSQKDFNRGISSEPFFNYGPQKYMPVEHESNISIYFLLISYLKGFIFFRRFHYYYQFLFVVYFKKKYLFPEHKSFLSLELWNGICFFLLRDINKHRGFKQIFICVYILYIFFLNPQIFTQKWCLCYVCCQETK